MASTYLQKFPVPEQFPELLHDLLKSILKEQPEDIIEFAYHYFKNKHEGLEDPNADNKNYYGKQIIYQKKMDHSEDIPAPNTQGGKLANAKIEVMAKKHTKEPEPVLLPVEENIHRPYRPPSQQTHQSDTSNQTLKNNTNEYYTDLADRVLDTYEQSYKRPNSSHEENDHSSASKKSLKARSDAIQEEDPDNENEEADGGLFD